MYHVKSGVPVAGVVVAATYVSRMALNAKRAFCGGHCEPGAVELIYTLLIGVSIAISTASSSCADDPGYTRMNPSPSHTTVVMATAVAYNSVRLLWSRTMAVNAWLASIEKVWLSYAVRG